MKRILFLFLLWTLPCFSQSSTKVAADCSFPFNFTATGRAPANGFPNGSTLPASTQSGCVGWVMVMEVTGFSGVSLQLESASDSSGAAGTWGAFSGSSVTLTGCGSTNPITATTQGCLSVNGYQPWVSAHLTSVTGSGTVAGTVYGCRIDHCDGLFQTAGSGGLTQNVNIQQVGGTNTVNGGLAGTLGVGGPSAAGVAPTGNPVPVAGTDGSGNARIPLVDSQGNQYSFLGCPSSVDVALSGTGYTEIVIGTASQVIRICKLFVTSSSGGNPVVNTFTVATATITSCASPTELMVGAGITGIDSDFGGALRSASGSSICVKEATANSDHVSITYQKAAF